MKFMILLKADKNSEAGALPDEKLLTEMGKYNEELAKAGIMLAGEGLHPTSKGARVKFAGGKHTVTNGPFPEDRKSTRLNSSHRTISYAVFCVKKKNGP